MKKALLFFVLGLLFVNFSCQSRHDSAQKIISSLKERHILPVGGVFELIYATDFWRENKYVFRITGLDSLNFIERNGKKLDPDLTDEGLEFKAAQSLLKKSPAKGERINEIIRYSDKEDLSDVFYVKTYEGNLYLVIWFI